MADRAGSKVDYRRMTKAQLFEELSALRRRVDSAELAVGRGEAGGPAPRSHGRRESAEFFRAVFDGTNDAILVIDPKIGRIFDANASACRMLGYSRRELLQIAVAEIYPRELARIEEFTREVIEHGDGRIDTLHCRTKSGDHVPVEMRASPIEMAGRSLLLVVARDISERLRDEKTRREADNQLRKVAEATPVPVVMTRKSDGIILYANPWFGLALGIAAEDAVGQTMRHFYADPQDRKILLRALEEKGFARNLEFRMRRADGATISTVHSIQGILYQGEECLLGAFNDVTERRTAEADRHRAEERLRDAIESIPDGLVLFDADDRVITWNDRFAELYPELAPLLPNEPTAEEMFRARHAAGAVGDFDVPADEYVAWRMEMRRKCGGTPAVHRHRDGRWFRTTERATREGGVVAISTDITELKLAQARLADAVESIPDGLVLFGKDNRVAMWNRRFAELYPELEPLLPNEPTAEEMFRARHEAGAVGEFDIPADQYVAWRMEMREKQGGTPAVHRHKDGRWFRTTERKTGEGGVVAISSDITELKMAQQRLVEAIESIGEGFAYFDADFRLAFCNENYRNRWPAARDNIVPGIAFIELAGLLWDHGYVRGTRLDKEAWLKQRMDQLSESAVVVREISPGTWIQMNEDPIRDGGFVQTVADISASVKAEAELRAARDQAEFASRTKTEFLANVSHELRTPLNAINGFSEIMASEMFGPLGDRRYIDYAKDILDSGNHLLSLINDILDLSKVEAGKLELDERDLDPADAVLACLKLIGERAHDGEVLLVNMLDRELPRLNADERVLKQIVINLLSNAVKFTPRGGKVTVRAGVAGDGCFVLTVSDTGIGMAEDEIVTALTPFSQVESSLVRKHDGTGLGLPLAKSLVESHGGTLEIVSEPGVGTNVHARFPAARIVEKESSRNDTSAARDTRTAGR